MSEMLTVSLTKPELFAYSQVAGELFVEASYRVPASVAGQACYIATACKILDYDPDTLGISLAHNEPLINRIQLQANNIHAARQNGPYDKDGNIKAITQEKAIEIICSDFQYASSMMILSIEEIVELLNHYDNRTDDSGAYADPEDEYRDRIDKKVYEKRVQLGLEVESTS